MRVNPGRGNGDQTNEKSPYRNLSHEPGTGVPLDALRCFIFSRGEGHAQNIVIFDWEILSQLAEDR